MKRKFILTFIVLTILMLVGCTNKNDGKIKMPNGVNAYEGANYQEVVNELKTAGFTNIKTKKMDDVVLGFFAKDGEVESVSINGSTVFSSDSRFESNAEIIITYHTSKANEEENDEPTEQTEETEQKEPTEQTEQTDLISNEKLTIDNCEDFANILKCSSEFDSSYSTFAETYIGQTIEFNGCITYLTNHGDYNTRYDILISAGDYVNADTANPGPIFKFEDVGLNDLGIKDLYLPDYVSVGNNISIQAIVIEFDENSGIFKLAPVLIESR